MDTTEASEKVIVLVTPESIRKNAALFRVSERYAFACRRAYLASRLKVLRQDMVRAKSDEEIVFTANLTLKVLRQLKSLDFTPNKGTVTDSMIESARSYPVELLIEFKKGKAIAFCHPDNNPSLSWDRKRNRVHCFPCGKDFGPIDILIDRDKMTFIEAVRELSR